MYQFVIARQMDQMKAAHSLREEMIFKIAEEMNVYNKTLSL
jgi:hypothetical protein